MDMLELFQRLAVALAIGLLVGVERGWKGRLESEGERAAGVRTFALSGLLGGIWGALAGVLGETGAVILGFAFLGFSAAIILFRWREMEHEGNYGMTTVVAAMVVFALGAFAVIGDMAVAGAAGVAAALLLAVKAALHDWVRRITWEELRAGLLLLAMTVILLPLLPDRDMGPFAALNPREIWQMTILISALSFAGYAAIKLTGEKRGTILTAIAGSLVSSTAVTLEMARLAKKHVNRETLYAAGAVLAGGAMMVRVIFVACFFNIELVRWLVPPLGLAALAMLGLAVVLLRRPSPKAGVDAPLELKNPFELRTAFAFSLLLALMLLLANGLVTVLGSAGAYGLAAASGLADVDAITLSMARLGRGEMGLEQKASAILIAAASNTLAKAAIAWVVGGPGVGVKVLLGALAGVTAILVGFLLAPYWNPLALFS